MVRQAIRRHCRQVTSDDLDDETAEVWRRVAGSLSGFQPGSAALSTWIWNIARNRGLRRLEVLSGPKNDTRDCVPLHWQVRSPSPHPDKHYEQREQLRKALDAVAALPSANMRRALELHVEGCTHKEIGAALGITHGAAKKQVWRAHEHLRKTA